MFLLTEYYEGELAHFQSAVFDTIRKQNLVARDYQPNLMIDVSVPCFLQFLKKKKEIVQTIFDQTDALDH